MTDFKRSSTAVWVKEKIKGFYSGCYSKDKKTGKRVFVLFTKLKNGKIKHYEFISPEQAKEKGWSRIL